MKSVAAGPIEEPTESTNRPVDSLIRDEAGQALLNDMAPCGVRLNGAIAGRPAILAGNMARTAGPRADGRPTILIMICMPAHESVLSLNPPYTEKMPTKKIDLRALAEHSGPERAFLTLYLRDSEGLKRLGPRIEQLRELLADYEVEREYLEENLRLVDRFFEEHDVSSKGYALFVCWAIDLLEGYPLDDEVEEMAWVDSSPYIRPLAQIQSDYQNFVVVAADNESTRVHLVTAFMGDGEFRVRGDVKNRVKVGGWSQQRYARRRKKELKHYANEVSRIVRELDEKIRLDQVLLLGSDETVREIQAALPEAVQEKSRRGSGVELEDEQSVWEEAFRLLEEKEQESDQALWERIEEACLEGGQAAMGPSQTLEAAQLARVSHLLLTRDRSLDGTECRDCQNQFAGKLTSCKACGSKSVFFVDLANELVEICEKTDARVEFVDSIPQLERMGHAAALLRY